MAKNKNGSGALISTVVRLRPEDRDALRALALRRAAAGRAARIDSSAILRELLAAWRTGATFRPLC